MKSIDLFIIERLKLNKNSKINNKENRIIVFPKTFSKESIIRKFISDLKSRECGEIQTKKTLWSIYIIIGSENIEKFKDFNKSDNKDMFCIYKFLPDMNLNNLRDWWENTKNNFKTYKDVIEFLDDKFDGYKIDISDI